MAGRDPLVVTDTCQVTPEWLTTALKRNGHLPRGRVADVEISCSSSFTAEVARLKLSYTRDSPSSAPRRLFLKMAGPSAGQHVVGREGFRREVRFHREIAAVMSRAPVVVCYDAQFSENSGASHLLFADLSDTHYQTAWPLPPPRAQCESAVDAFAAFHAFWWDHPELARIEELPTAESTADYVRSIRECYPGFAEFLGDRLSDERRRIYDRVLEVLPRLFGRLTRGSGRSGLTLIHGDANFWNVLLPRDAGEAPAYIIDWQLWNVSFSADDLSNLIALHLFADRRRVLERDLLARYHTGLLRHGVRDYSWAGCLHDYRLAVVTRVLFMPMWQWSSGQPPSSWWAHLERAMQAFHDLDCRELLG